MSSEIEQKLNEIKRALDKEKQDIESKKREGEAIAKAIEGLEKQKAENENRLREFQQQLEKSIKPKQRYGNREKGVAGKIPITEIKTEDSRLFR